MNKTGNVILSLLALFLSSGLSAENNDGVTEVFGVITRFTKMPSLPVDLILTDKSSDGCDEFETSVTGGRLKIKGSSPVALCRGFYDFTKKHDAGISSWTGNRFSLPDLSADENTVKTKSPFRDHYYFNVVTYGYTMPYWDWERWEQEIDWMALHGIDMPLALVAQEAIMKRVWRRLGLSDDEIDNYFVGPAHLPWMRMGNISGIDGPLPQSWHDSQIELQHRILGRMKTLGMKPICPGFAGFVPKSITDIFPDAKIIETSWCDGAFHNWMVSPDQELFSLIGKMFIEEWENEFGPNERYIIDSFNEMDIPFPPKGESGRYTLLAEYGEAVYNSVKAANPEAIWVLQGWMFGYQRGIWDCRTLEALVSKVPDDKILLLDLAEDYNHCFWKNGANWDYYKGFFNKDWVYSVIPNMGGKTGLTGDIEFYANGGRLKALNSENKGSLTGYGMAPEGIENNVVIYELLSDGGWTADSIPLDKWLENYSACRYGRSVTALNDYWDGLRGSVYGSFTDHPRFNWQFRPGTVTKGSINFSDRFFNAIESFADASSQLKDSDLYVNDLLEMTAHYLGAKMEILTSNIDYAYQTHDTVAAVKYEKQFEDLAMSIDRVLESHPLLRLDRWLSYADKAGADKATKDRYTTNARRIVTVWGPPVDDYSARIWSGLVGGYYLPRWKQYFQSRKSGEPASTDKWELDWVNGIEKTAPSEPYADPVSECISLIKSAKNIHKPADTKKVAEQAEP